MVEGARAQAREWSEPLARGVDGSVGDSPFEDGGQVTNGLVSLGIFYRRDQGSDIDLRFHSHFWLPNFEESAYLFLGRDVPRLLVKNALESLNANQQLLNLELLSLELLASGSGTQGTDVGMSDRGVPRKVATARVQKLVVG